MKKEKYHNQREQFEMKCELNVNGSWVKFHLKENDEADPNFEERYNFHEKMSLGEEPDGPPIGPFLDQMNKDGLLCNKLVSYDTYSIAELFVKQRTGEWGEENEELPAADDSQKFWSAFMLNFTELINQMFHMGCKEYHEYWLEVRKDIASMKQQEDSDEDI